jgi:hypothetical protein
MWTQVSGTSCVRVNWYYELPCFGCVVYKCGVLAGPVVGSKHAQS